MDINAHQKPSHMPLVNIDGKLSGFFLVSYSNMFTLHRLVYIFNIVKNYNLFKDEIESSVVLQNLLRYCNQQSSVGKRMTSVHFPEYQASLTASNICLCANDIFHPMFEDGKTFLYDFICFLFMYLLVFCRCSVTFSRAKRNVGSTC